MAYERSEGEGIVNYFELFGSFVTGVGKGEDTMHKYIQDQLENDKNETHT